MKNIYIGNLAYSVNQDELNNIFSEFGEVTKAYIIMDKYSGRSKGFGFVEMANDEEAKKAIEQLNEKEIQGRPIRVNEARPRQEN